MKLFDWLFRFIKRPAPVFRRDPGWGEAIDMRTSPSRPMFDPAPPPAMPPSGRPPDGFETADQDYDRPPPPPPPGLAPPPPRQPDRPNRMF
jgi:hypothetical protein